MAFITRTTNHLKLSGSDWRAAGINLYWPIFDLGLWGARNVPGTVNVAYASDFRIQNGVRAAKELGCNFIRLYNVCSVGSAHSMFPDGVNINSTAAERFDLFLKTCADEGLRAWIVICDSAAGNDFFSGSIRTWSTTLGGDGSDNDFFTNSTRIAGFKSAVSSLLNRASSITGLKPYEDDTIFCYELGGEIDTAPDAWISDLASYVKGIAANQLICDGVSLTSARSNSLSDSNVDIVTQHAYPLNSSAIATYSATVGAAKVVVWGEYDMNRIGGGSTLADWIAAAEADWPATWATCPWQLPAHADVSGPADYDNTGPTSGSPGYSTLPYATATRSNWIAVRDHSYAMRGISVPSAGTCPAPVADATGMQKLIWRGSAAVDEYRIETSSNGFSGWASESTGKKDSDAPLAVGSATFRRVVPINIDGSDGTPSNAIYTGGTITGIPASLVAYWPLNESSGNAIDAANRNDLAETFGSIGTSGGMRDFNASENEYFLAIDNSDFSTGDIDFTLQALVNLTSKTTYRMIVAKWVSGNKEYILFYDQANDRFSFGVSNDGSAETFVRADNLGSPSTGVTYLLHAWHDSVNNVIGIAVDAGSANTSSYSAGVLNSTCDFRIGAYSEASPLSMDGQIGEVALFKRVLSGQDRTDQAAANGAITFQTWPEPPAVSGLLLSKRRKALLCS